jgi:hypothetical protein
MINVNEHPSLKTVKPQAKTAAETILELNRGIISIHEAIVSMKQKSMIVEADLSSLNSVSILASLEQRFTDFTVKYGEVLDALNVNAQGEAELIVLLKDKISKL